jgi:hypothetical protein
VHAGFYTVSAHVPMGQNLAATPDGRHARTPLADGGLSPMYGRDRRGPTAVLQSVARMPADLGSNGTLLNMKFLPEFFDRDEGSSGTVSTTPSSMSFAPRTFAPPRPTPKPGSTWSFAWPGIPPTSRSWRVSCRRRSSREPPSEPKHDGRDL